MRTGGPNRPDLLPGYQNQTLGLLYGVAMIVMLAWLTLILCWDESLLALTYDDAFYYFGIARHWAAGAGSTFDGINPTNGYHPLWLWLCVPAFWMGLDGDVAVRSLLAAQALGYGAALLMVARLTAPLIDGWPQRLTLSPDRAGQTACWRRRAAAAALLLMGLMPVLTRAAVNGLETGVLVLLDAVLLAIGIHWRTAWLTRSTPSGRLKAALLLTLIVLTRTDAALLLAGLGLWVLPEAVRLGRLAWRPLAELFTLPTLVLSSYLLANRLWFGAFIQISGLVKHAPHTTGRLLAFAAVAVLAGYIGWLGQRRAGHAVTAGRFWRLREFTAATAWYLAFCVLLVGYYLLLQTQQWLWYFCPLTIYGVCLAVLGMADFAEAALLEAPETQTPDRALAPVAMILMTPLAALLGLQVSDLFDPSLRSSQLANRMAAQWVAATLPPDAVLAAWDAGMLGYYARRPVINLDGVANSLAYWQAAQRHSAGAFLADRGLTHIINHSVPVGDRDPVIDQVIQSWWGADAAARAIVIQRWPFVFSGTTVGAAGQHSGRQEMAVLLYQLPPLPITPRSR